MGFDRFTDILSSAKRRFPGFARRLGEAQALSRWEEAVGPAIGKHSRAAFVRDKVLWVEVGHPIWRTELHHRKQQILEILNKDLNHPIEDLWFFDPRSQVRRSPFARKKPGPKP